MKKPAELPWAHYLLAAWMLLTLLFSALAPSASEGLSFAARFLFWAVHVGVPILLLQAAQIIVARIAHHLSDWVSVTLSGFLGALAFVPVATGLDQVFPDPDDAKEPLSAALTSEALSTVLPVMLVWVALNAPRLLRIREAAEAQDTPANTAQTSEFWAKVPHSIGRDLVSLSAELHYLRVRTRNGDALILYPFGKAVANLDFVAGQQIHRSHWVALDQITAIKRRGDGASAQMTSGPALPVSRKYRKALNATWQETTATRAQTPVTGA